jgi:hypothetical protein
VKIVSRGERITEKYRQPYMVLAVDRSEGYQSDTRLVVGTHWQCLACSVWFEWSHECALR